MEKKKSYKLPHDKREAAGIHTKLLDCDRREIITGDIVRLKSNPYYSGPVMWNRHQECFGIFMGLWYEGQDKYNPDCYGKFIRIPKDNGMRMDIETIEKVKI